MTKDEAWKAHVEEYDRDRFDSTSRHRRHCFDAGWEAALADTLGMLEALAKRDEGDDSCEIPWAEFGRGTRSPSVAVSGYQEGLRYFRVDEDGTEHPISRDDALAPLAGEEKKECP